MQMGFPRYLNNPDWSAPKGGLSWKDIITLSSVDKR